MDINQLIWLFSGVWVGLGALWVGIFTLAGYVYTYEKRIAKLEVIIEEKMKK